VWVDDSTNPGGSAARELAQIKGSIHMAQKYIVQLVDDLTQEPIDDGAGETVRFSLDGVGYTIDLTSSHADDLRNALAPFVGVARKADAGAKAKAAAKAPKGDLKAIRDWANANGFTVSSRGRIPANVQNAYRLAN
jgi:Lsr2